MEKDYLKYIIQNLYKDEGNAMYKNNADFIQSEIRGGEYITETNFSNFYKGNFYFVYYDLDGNSSKMEQFNPVLLLDTFNFKGIPKYYTLNINFLPIAVRVLFFNTVLNNNLNVIEKNTDVKPLKQIPLSGISFSGFYYMLKRIGFEWAIRELDADKINKIYKVSTDILSKFIAMSTASYTGVDDSKLVSIWQAKIQKQDIREQQMIKKLIESYENMSNDFDKQYKDLNTRMDNLEESIKIIKTMNT